MYTDRKDAGQQLAGYLAEYRGRDAVVLALPRGGVVVGYEIAEALDVPLDVLVARKLGAPLNPEFAFGAIGPGGVTYLDDRSVRLLGLSDEQIQRVARRELAELDRRMRAYRGEQPEPRIAGRTVILADDGLATGSTAIAALRALRRQKPKLLVLAVPVAPADTIRRIEPEADRVVCPGIEEDFRAVSQFYMQFDQTDDEEVLQLLGRARSRTEHRA